MIADQLIAWFSTEKELTLVSVGLLMLAFTLSGLVFVPRTILSLAAGALYGIGTIPIVMTGNTLGAVLAFLFARYVAADYVQRLIDRGPLLKRISNAVDAEGWRIVALARFGAPIPGAVSNYLFGMTNIGLWPYTWATFLFCIPQVILFVCLGAAGRAALLQDSGSTVSEIMLAIAILTSALAVYLVSKRARTSFGSM